MFTVETICGQRMTVRELVDDPACDKHLSVVMSRGRDGWNYSCGRCGEALTQAQAQSIAEELDRSDSKL